MTKTDDTLDQLSTSFIGIAMQKEPSSKKGNRGKSLKMLPHAKIEGLVLKLSRIQKGQRPYLQEVVP
jgi:hypothetical protein